MGTYGMFLEPWLLHFDEPFMESTVHSTWMTYNLMEGAALGLATWDSDEDGTATPLSGESSIETQPECAMSEWSDSEHEC